MSIIDNFLALFFKSRLNDLYESHKKADDTQPELMRSLIQKAKDTEWGRKHHFSEIRTYNDYTERNGLNDYDSLKSTIHRMMKGEQNLLWPTKVKWFAQSSGTTNDKSKFIPISNEGLDDCHFNGGKNLYALYYENYPESRIGGGKALVLGGSHKISSLNEGIKQGDLSAILLQNSPWYATMRRAPDLETALIPDYEKKIEKIAQESLNEDIRQIMGVPTWAIVLIKHLFEITGKNDLREIWPNMEVYVHGGVSFTPYRELFKELIPHDDMNYWENYNATEGYFAVQDSKERDDMLLLLNNGVFYEFIPEAEMDSDNPRTITIADVKAGEKYALVITTNSGLWRYQIGDTIIFTSTDPYRIKIAGRTKLFINAFGEEVMIGDVEIAISNACQKTGASIQDFTAAPVFFSEEGNGAHEWLIEFEKEPEDLKRFSEILDQSLKSVNSDYEAKRHKNLALSEPVVEKVPAGTFYRWMKKRGKLGGQNKVPRLYNDRKFIEDIKEFLRDG